MKKYYIEDNSCFESLWSYDGTTWVNFADRMSSKRWKLFDEPSIKTCDMFESWEYRGHTVKEYDITKSNITEKNLFLMFL